MHTKTLILLSFLPERKVYYYFSLSSLSSNTKHIIRFFLVRRLMKCWPAEKEKCPKQVLIVYPKKLDKQDDFTFTQEQKVGFHFFLTKFHSHFTVKHRYFYSYDTLFIGLSLSKQRSVFVRIPTESYFDHANWNAFYLTMDTNSD